MLVYTSLLFITNSMTTFYKKQWIYCFLFVCLTVSSVMFHAEPNMYTNVLDKLSIFFVVVYGAYRVYMSKPNHMQWTVILGTFLSTLILFYYGYCTSTLCYSPTHGDLYHGILHLISSIGHHFITFL